MSRSIDPLGGVSCDGVEWAQADAVRRVVIRIATPEASGELSLPKLAGIVRGDVPVQIGLADGLESAVFALGLDLDASGSAPGPIRTSIVASANGFDMNSDGLDDISAANGITYRPRITGSTASGTIDLRLLGTTAPEVRHPMIPDIQLGGFGSTRPSVIYGPPDMPMSIWTGDGADIIVTGSGADTIVSGNGRDIVHSGAGNDMVASSGDADKVWTGPGDDFAFPDYPMWRQDNTHRPGPGDQVDLGSGNDLAQMYGGDDRIAGGTGNDILRDVSGEMEPADPRLDGGVGDDTLTVSTLWGARSARCGGGRDTMRYIAGVLRRTFGTRAVGAGCEYVRPCEQPRMSWSPFRGTSFSNFRSAPTFPRCNVRPPS